MLLTPFCYHFSQTLPLAFPYFGNFVISLDCVCVPMHAQVCRHEAYKGKLEVPSSDIPQGLSTLSFEAGYLIGT